MPRPGRPGEDHSTSDSQTCRFPRAQRSDGGVVAATSVARLQ